nr:MAG TPA: hypothetical protein [Caudoviricetes sp.]
MIDCIVSLVFVIVNTYFQIFVIYYNHLFVNL